MVRFIDLKIQGLFGRRADFVLLILRALAHAVGEVDNDAEHEPDAEAQPGVDWEQHHEIEIHEHREEWEDVHERNFEGGDELVLWLLPDQVGDGQEEGGEEDEQDYGHYVVQVLQDAARHAQANQVKH